MSTDRDSTTPITARQKAAIFRAIEDNHSAGCPNCTDTWPCATAHLLARVRELEAGLQTAFEDFDNLINHIYRDTDNEDSPAADECVAARDRVEQLLAALAGGERNEHV